VQVSFALGAAMEGEDPSKETRDAREQLRNEAANAAAKADVAIIVVGRSRRWSRKALTSSRSIFRRQDDLIEAVAKPIDTPSW